MNVLISTTTHWNPGDDFIREGIINLLPELRGHNIQYWNRSPRVHKDSFEELVDWCDLYLHAGTPDWLHNHEPEYQALRERGKHYAFIGVGNPGGNQQFERYDNWLKDVLTDELCLAMIVRDTATADALAERSIPHAHLPCPAFFVFDEPSEESSLKSVVGLGMYGFGQPGHLHHPEVVWGAGTYFAFFKQMEDMLCNKGVKTIAICHTRPEYDAARRHLASPAFLSARWEDYLPVYGTLACYVGSRVHGAITAASAYASVMHLGIDVRQGTCDGFPHITNRPWQEVTAEEAIAFCESEFELPFVEVHSWARFNQATRDKYRVALRGVLNVLGGA